MQPTRQRLFSAIVVCSTLLACEPNTPNSYQWQLPENFPPPVVPANNPMSDAKVELGRFLFYDPNLSFNRQQSCASCHQQKFAFAEPLPTSIGSSGEPLARNASALVNVGYNSTLTWAHPYLRQLERQILIPLFNEDPIEMGLTGHEEEVLDRLTQTPYPELFNQAFGSQQPTLDTINNALACFVRSLISFQSRFDRYAFFADDSALSVSEQRGMDLFFSERLECHHCHGGLNFSQTTGQHDEAGTPGEFNNIGLYNIKGKHRYPTVDQGVYEVTGRKQDIGAFRAPSLRNVAQSAPYMHDGSVASLAEVIEIYNAGGRNITQGELQGDGRSNRYKSVFIKPLHLSKQEKTDLLAFLHTLSDQQFLHNPAFANPWQ